MRNEKEHHLQKALFEWMKLVGYKYPELDLAFAIPNGGHRHMSVARKLKEEGVKAGVPDIFIPVPSGIFHGMFIECKIKPNKLTNNQTNMIKMLERIGYCCVVVYELEEAINHITKYMDLREKIIEIQIK